MNNSSRFVVFNLLILVCVGRDELAQGMESDRQDVWTVKRRLRIVRVVGVRIPGFSSLSLFPDYA